MSTPAEALVSVVNLGCRVNRVEADLIAERLEALGCAIVGEDEASAIVVNTCAVTAEAEAKTRKTVRHCAQLPQAPLVVATGCVANLFSDEIEALGPNVVVEADKSRVADLVSDALGLSSCSAGSAAGPKPTPTGRTRPGVKVQDGCDNRCTYCIVWKARGASRSVDADEVVSRVRAAVARGAREVVLTGINLGCYAHEGADGTIGLPGLLRRVLAETNVGRLRLSSIEPPDVTQELVSTMAEAGERVAPFLHVCLQSGSDDTLLRMGRVYDTALYRERIAMARELLPTLSLGTDLIVGFPGETDDEFASSLAFTEEMRFSKMHVFRYSKRPGTPAAEMPGQVDPRVMAERGHAMRSLASRMRAEAAHALVGSEDLVVVQYPGRGITGGLFDVLVDPSVEVDSLVRARLVSCDSRGVLSGVVL